MPFAHVVLTGTGVAHLDQAYTYRVPDGVSAGAVVRVPVRGRSRVGVVVSVFEDADVPRVQPIRAVLGSGLPADVVQVAHSIAEHYLSSFGEALDAAIPPRVASEEEAVVSSTHREHVRTDLRWLDAYRGGPALRAAISGAKHAAFSWRPLAFERRGDAIASLVAATLDAGRGALVLLPEVRVSSEVADALAKAFGDRVAWLGSDRSERDRYRAWLDLKAGARDIAVGGRAAVFAPVLQLGLVVVDDESHISFKERRVPRFHARPVAWQRARHAGAVFVATGVPPSVEAFEATQRGVLSPIVPPRASEMRSRPAVLVVDRTRSDDRHTPSAKTLASVRSTLESGKRAVVLIHRVGDEARAIANRVVKNSGALNPARLDARSLSKNREEFDAALAKADLIVASPVIAKDLELENVGCVVVLEADAALSVPEFRSAEEAFATWWRAGRWLGAGEIFVIETSHSRQDAIAALVHWNPERLLRAECARRAELGYPPFAALVRVDCPNEKAAAVIKVIEKAAPDASILGPVEKETRSTLVVRSPDRHGLIEALAVLAKQWRAEGTDIRIDVDPRDVLK